MAGRLLDYNPETKTEYRFHAHLDETPVIEAIQDAEEIVKYNALMAGALNKKADWWFVGSIPLQICHQWAQESSTKVFTRAWQEYAKKQVQLPEYRKLNPNRIRM